MKSIKNERIVRLSSPPTTKKYPHTKKYLPRSLTLRSLILRSFSEVEWLSRATTQNSTLKTQNYLKSFRARHGTYHIIPYFRTQDTLFQQPHNECRSDTRQVQSLELSWILILQTVVVRVKSLVILYYEMVLPANLSSN